MHPWIMFLVVVSFLSLVAHDFPMYDKLIMRSSHIVLACCSVIPPGAGQLTTGCVVENSMNIGLKAHQTREINAMMTESRRYTKSIYSCCSSLCVHNNVNCISDIV